MLDISEVLMKVLVKHVEMPWTPKKTNSLLFLNHFRLVFDKQSF